MREEGATLASSCTQLALDKSLVTATRNKIAEHRQPPSALSPVYRMAGLTPESRSIATRMAIPYHK